MTIRHHGGSMFFRRHAALALAAMLAFLAPALTGCSSNVGGHDYKAADAQRSYSVHQGTVVSVQPVTIHGDTRDQQTLGGIIGAVAGGVIGSTIGGGSGRTLSSLGGALLGGAAGAGAGTLTSRETGLQIILRDDHGNEEVVVQGAEPAIQPGQRVRVIVGADGSRRVEPAY
jgi:outer membrane lipoprotein SlyB